MNFEEFLQQRRKWLRAHPEHKDGGETALYRFLKQKHSEALPEILPSEHSNAPHRCHLTEVFLDFLQLSRVWKPNVLVSEGVRHSLKIIFNIWKEEGRMALLPGDVYPAYIELAKEVGIRHMLFSQRDFSVDAIPDLGGEVKLGILLCDPIKPWATGPVSISTLQKLLKLQTKDVQIVLDSAYDFKRNSNSETLALIRSQAPIIRLSSLSKGWLIPLHGGFVVGPTSIMEKWRPYFSNEKSQPEKLKIAYAALTERKEMYETVQQIIFEHQMHGLETLHQLSIPVDSFHQYFAHTPISWKELRDQHKVFGIPASVFGDSYLEKGTIISLLNL